MKQLYYLSQVAVGTRSHRNCHSLTLFLFFPTIIAAMAVNQIEFDEAIRLILILVHNFWRRRIPHTWPETAERGFRQTRSTLGRMLQSSRPESVSKILWNHQVYQIRILLCFFLITCFWSHRIFSSTNSKTRIPAINWILYVMSIWDVSTYCEYQRNSCAVRVICGIFNATRGVD